MASTSHILAVPSLQGLAPLPTVVAYGDPEDHLRLTVLLASLLGEGLDPRYVAVCTGRGTPWPKRKRALKHLLQEAQSRAQGTMARLVDPDALDIGELSPTTRWDDATFQRERQEFFELLLESIAEGGWQLIRQELRPWTTDKLEEVGCEALPTQVSGAATSVDEHRLEGALSRLVSPALRPLLQALVATGRLRAREAARLLESSQSPLADDLVLELAYDALSAEAVEAAKRLAVLRGPHRWNGVAGPFTLSDAPLDIGARLDCVPRAAALELFEGRWVDITTEGGGQRRFIMANAIRRFLQARASITGPDRMLAEHRWLASREPVGVGQRVEVHYHAVESLDPSLAERTARYYGADLRRIAFELSTKKRQYSQAAEIYRLIVREFDPEDAYAWEYLGFNLAYSYEGKELPEAAQREIREAYARASRLYPENPLYKGRELAFRARAGERVLTEFQRYLRYFRRKGDEGVSYFARPVLEALSPQGRQEIARQSWAEELTHHPTLRDFF